MMLGRSIGCACCGSCLVSNLWVNGPYSRPRSTSSGMNTNRLDASLKRMADVREMTGWQMMDKASRRRRGDDDVELEVKSDEVMLAFLSTARAKQAWSDPE